MKCHEIFQEIERLKSELVDAEPIERARKFLYIEALMHLADKNGCYTDTDPDVVQDNKDLLLKVKQELQ